MTRLRTIEITTEELARAIFEVECETMKKLGGYGSISGYTAIADRIINHILERREELQIDEDLAPRNQE